MKRNKFLTGAEKAALYLRISLDCAWRLKSPRTLFRAAGFTKVFFRHKVRRLPGGRYKLDFYMPAYPSDAFFRAMEDKLLWRPPRPISVVLSITKACVCRCPHCYQRQDPAEELPLDRLLQNVRELRDFGISAWAVEGGEPLLKFERLAAVLRELAGQEVWVNSNGFSATDEKISIMSELGVTGVMSSIHSPDPETHDAFTGVPGSHEQALLFLEKCRRKGMLTGFNTVLGDEAVLSGGIEKIMVLAEEREVDYVQLIHPKPSGRWLGRNLESALSSEAVQRACEAQIRYNSGKEKHSPILTAQVFEESPEMLGCCGGGIDRFYIGAAGDVQPCEFVNLSFGNLKDVSFRTAFERMREAFPVPCCEWICRTRAPEIAAAAEKLAEERNHTQATCKRGEKTDARPPQGTESGRTVLPLPWEKTRDLVAKWKKQSGTPTPLYQKMGIYR